MAKQLIGAGFASDLAALVAAHLHSGVHAALELTEPGARHG